IILTVKYVKMLGELAMCADIWGGEPECVQGGIDAIQYVASDYPQRGNTASTLSKVDMGLSIFQSGIALAAPVAGIAASVDSSLTYKMHSNGTPIGFGFSPMNLPDPTTLSSLGRKIGPEYGLPVTHEKLGNDCAHLIDLTGNAVLDLIHIDVLSKLMNAVSGMAGAAFQWYYCGSDTDMPPMPFSMPKFPKPVASLFEGVLHEALGGGDAADYWSKEGFGPMVMYKHKPIDPSNLLDYIPAHKDRHKKEQKNGADHQQVYSISFALDSFQDNHASHNIGLMQLQHEQGFQTPEQKAKGFFVPILFYYAEAELYADCDPTPDKWDTHNCDDVGVDNDRMDYFLYKFAWRARLVAVHAPAGGLKKFFDSIGTGLGYVSNVKSYINGGDDNSFIRFLHMVDDIFDTSIGQQLIDEIGNVADYIPDDNYH
ncbi:MAG TPA: hypothetical protein VF407_09155, partial [Polyangiaceae bacterium]